VEKPQGGYGWLERPEVLWNLAAWMGGHPEPLSGSQWPPGACGLAFLCQTGAWYSPHCPWGGCCPADGKAWYPDEYRQPEPGNQSRQPPDAVHSAAHSKPQRLDYRTGRKTERAACTKNGGESDTSSQSADEVYGDTKRRTEGLDKGWTEPGDFTGLKGSQRSIVLSPAKGTFHCGGLRSVSGSVREISRRLPQSDEAKGSPQQSDWRDSCQPDRLQRM